MRRLITGLALTGALIVASVAPTFAGRPDVGTLWLDGQQVRTIVPPAASPKQGRDALYRVPDTGGVAAVGPGDKGYHGGKWAVYDVTFKNGSFPLRSEADILQAKKDGLITVVRNAGADFKCPLRGR